MNRPLAGADFSQADREIAPPKLAVFVRAYAEKQLNATCSHMPSHG